MHPAPGAKKSPGVAVANDRGLSVHLPKRGKVRNQRLARRQSTVRGKHMPGLCFDSEAAPHNKRGIDERGGFHRTGGAFAGLRQSPAGPTLLGVCFLCSSRQHCASS
jgi:hypothetical protein